VIDGIITNKHWPSVFIVFVVWAKSQFY